MFHACIWTGSAKRSYLEHQAIAEAVCAGEADEAEKRLKAHTRESLQHLIAIAEK